MIDIHTHIMYDLDDGAIDLKESMKLLRLLQSEGVTDVICTPHAPYEVDYTLEDYFIRFNILLDSIEDEGLDIKLHSGQEVRLSEDNVSSLAYDSELNTLANSRYVLVEPAPHLEIGSLECGMIEDIKLSGLIPILAHPERLSLSKETRDNIKMLREEGMLMQLTASSLLGTWGKDAQELANYYVKNDLIDFIASDTHRIKTRRPHLKEAYDYLKQTYDDDKLYPMFVGNAKKILECE